MPRIDCNFDESLSVSAHSSWCPRKTIATAEMASGSRVRVCEPHLAMYFTNNNSNYRIVSYLLDDMPYVVVDQDPGDEC